MYGSDSLLSDYLASSVDGEGSGLVMSSSWLAAREFASLAFRCAELLSVGDYLCDFSKMEIRFKRGGSLRVRSFSFTGREYTEIKRIKRWPFFMRFYRDEDMEQAYKFAAHSFMWIAVLTALPERVSGYMKTRVRSIDPDRRPVWRDCTHSHVGGSFDVQSR